MISPDRRTSCPRRGLTLIESLVAVAIIGLMVAWLLPAVQASREASRRAWCANNLRQLALGFHHYAGQQGVFPMGTPTFPLGGGDVTSNHSAFVAILPQVERTDAYNSVNFAVHIRNVENLTLARLALGTLWCPSDGEVGTPSRFPGGYGLNRPAPFDSLVVHHSSYSACSGTWYHDPDRPKGPKNLAAFDNGMAYVQSATRFADVFDGTSNTILLGERAYGRLPIDDGDPAHLVRALASQWIEGGFDTLFWTLRPINSPLSLDIPEVQPTTPICQASVAASFHPGGSNFAFVDGSVHFLRETINSWPIDSSSGFPIGVSLTTQSAPIIKPGTRLGVYQALSTRSGFEVIGSDY